MPAAPPWSPSLHTWGQVRPGLRHPCASPRAAGPGGGFPGNRDPLETARLLTASHSLAQSGGRESRGPLLPQAPEGVCWAVAVSVPRRDCRDRQWPCCARGRVPPEFTMRLLRPGHCWAQAEVHLQHGGLSPGTVSWGLR